MNAELENLRKWLHGNKLTLNVAETTSMIIGTNRTIHKSNSRELIQAHLKISGKAIEQKKSAKYLAVILDNQMKWKDHIGHISLKVSKAIGMIKYAKKVISTNFLKKLYLGASRASFKSYAALLGANVGSFPTKP